MFIFYILTKCKGTKLSPTYQIPGLCQMARMFRTNDYPQFVQSLPLPARLLLSSVCLPGWFSAFFSPDGYPWFWLTWGWDEIRPFFVPSHSFGSGLGRFCRGFSSQPRPYSARMGRFSQGFSSQPCLENGSWDDFGPDFIPTCLTKITGQRESGIKAAGVEIGVWIRKRDEGMKEDYDSLLCEITDFFGW